jgi:hypothetical protein
MSLKQTVSPLIEPVDLATVKLHLRIDTDDEDTLITSLIAAAREDCEAFQNRAYINQTYELWLDSFPSKDYIEIPLPPLQVPVVTAGAFVTGITYRILSVGTTNFVAIGASASTVGVVFTATGAGSGTGTATASCIIRYFDTSDVEYQVSGADYFVDSKSEPGRVCLNYSTSWPSTTLRSYNAVSITFVAGYSSVAEGVPIAIRHAILMTVAELYEYRIGLMPANDPPIPHAVESLLWKSRIVPV